MNLTSVRRFCSWFLTPLAASLPLVISGCGGGGASTSPEVGGTLQISAPQTTFANVPTQIMILGGRTPYAVVSNEPTLLPVPSITSDHTITVLAGNPGVVDPGLQPGELPVRTVTITVRDSNGLTATAQTKVGQNFFTGYGVTYLSNCQSSGVSGAQACAGGQTSVTLDATTNGFFGPGRQIRFDVEKGPFFWLFPSGAIAGGSVTTTTDEHGNAIAIFQVNQNVTTQLAVLRATDVATGMYADYVFTISGVATTATLTIIPNKFTFTGALKTTCGTGSVNFLVFDGQPPYTAFSSDPNLSVAPATSSTQPGQFTLSAFNPNVCLTAATIVVTDANLARGTVTVDTKLGTASPPPPPLQVQPTSVSVGCGQTVSASVIGGSGTYSVSTTDPHLTVTTTGNTVSISRLGAAPQIGTTFTTSTVTITDGTSFVTLQVTSPATCS